LGSNLNNKLKLSFKIFFQPLKLLSQMFIILRVVSCSIVNSLGLTPILLTNSSPNSSHRTKPLVLIELVSNISGYIPARRAE